MAASRPALRFAHSIAAMGAIVELTRDRRWRWSSCQSFRFGIIADIQYADEENAGPRNYRNVLKVVQNARKWWRDQDLAFVVHAGDLIDEREAKKGVAASEAALAAVMKDLPADKDVLCLVGNHDLYNFSRDRMREISRDTPCRFVDATGSFYYRYEPAEALAAGWRFLILDAYDLSLMSSGCGGDLDQSALAYMAAHNSGFAGLVGNRALSIYDVNGGKTCNWFEALGAERSLRWRWVPFNGAVSQDQLKWLRGELEEATHLGLKVGIISHSGFHPTTGGGGKSLTWNYDDVMRLIQSVDGACVQFVFNGHRHDGGFGTDEFGIHHCTFESPLLNSPGDPGCFAAVEVCPDKLLIRGYAPRREALNNGGYGRTLDAEDAFTLQTRELSLRSFAKHA